MAGPRYRNYFPDTEIDTGFNSKKYKSYFPWLGAKGLFLLRIAKLSKTAENTDLHGNAYIKKSRSTAGSFGQTDNPDLVVSASVRQILLSSVIPISQLAINVAVLSIFDHFRILLDSPD